MDFSALCGPYPYRASDAFAFVACEAVQRSSLTSRLVSVVELTVRSVAWLVCRKAEESPAGQVDRDPGAAG
jgi:hypothetical protein